MRRIFCVGVCALAAVCCDDKDTCGSTCSSESDDLSLIQLRRRVNATEEEALAAGAATVGEAISTEDVNSTSAMCMCTTGQASASCCQRRRGGGGFQWPPNNGGGGGNDGGGGGGNVGWGGGGGSTCDRNPGGFECPANRGCLDSNENCNEDSPGEWESWVDIHNIYRCMHNVPSVQWSNAMYKNVHNVFKNQRQMSHSNCYQVQPPAGPAGENLAWASWSLSAEESTKMWYDEVNNCGTMPGCKTGARGVTGHFTALIWDGVKEIGCSANHHGLRACQYRGGDSLDCTTPNMGGHYETNVFAAVKSKSECERIVANCKAGGGGDSGSGDAASPDDKKKKKKKDKKKKKEKKDRKGRKNKKNKKDRKGRKNKKNKKNCPDGN